MSLLRIFAVSLFAKTLTLIFFILLCLPVRASETLFSTCLEEGKKLVKGSDFVGAERQLELARQNSEHLKRDSAQMLELYELLGSTYCQTGKQSQAEEVLRQSLDVREHASKRDDVHIFGTIMMLGTVYRNQNKFAESEALYKKGLSMFEGSGPIKNLCQATVLYALGTLYLEMGKPSEAETFLDKSLKLRGGSFLKTALPPQGIYDALGRAYMAQGKNDEAEKSLKTAIDLSRKAKSETSLAFAEANLSSVYVNTGRYDEARSLLNDSAKIIERTHGPQSSEAATCYSNLAQVAICQDRYEEAESLCNKARELHEKLLGPNHTTVAYDLSKLTIVLRNQGKYDKAAEYARRCCDIFTAALGRDNPVTAQAITVLANIYADQGQSDLAKQLSEEAFAIVKSHSGASSLDLAPILITLSRIAADKKDTASAIYLLSQSTEILENNPNADPSILARDRSDLGFLLKQDNQLDKAEESIKRAIAVREKLYGVDDARLLADLGTLSKIYQKQNRPQDEASVNQRINLITSKHPELSKAPPPAACAPVIAASPALASRGVQDKWALVIGISNFADPSINLKYAAKDSIDFASYLVKDAHFAADHVKVLTDQNATRDNIIKQLGDSWLGRRAGRNDLVVIYISSHGSVSHSEAGGVNFLVAHDTEPDALLGTGIPMQWLSQIIKEQVHSDRVVLILDVCHSGSAAGEKGLSRQAGFDVEKVEVGAGQAIICSSAPDQVSWESKTYPNSVFTHRLIESLERKNAEVDLNEAFDYLREQVESEVLRERGKLQTPLLFSKSWQGPPPVLSVRAGKQDASE